MNTMTFLPFTSLLNDSSNHNLVYSGDIPVAESGSNFYATLMLPVVSSKKVCLLSILKYTD